MLIVDMSMEYTNAVKVTKILSIFSFILYGQKVEPHRNTPGTINIPFFFPCNEPIVTLFTLGQ